MLCAVTGVLKAPMALKASPSPSTAGQRTTATQQTSTSVGTQAGRWCLVPTLSVVMLTEYPDCFSLFIYCFSEVISWSDVRCWVSACCLSSPPAGETTKYLKAEQLSFNTCAAFQTHKTHPPPLTLALCNWGNTRGRLCRQSK